MKTLPLIALAGLVAVTACATASKSNNAALDALNSGPSVFDVQTPEVYKYSDAEPGYNDRLAKAWEELPPQVPHSVSDFLPVTIEDNECLDCHDVPKYIGQPVNTDRTIKNKSPMSKDHYATAELDEIDGARFNCTQCHVPQSNAPVLVDSTYR